MPRKMQVCSEEKYSCSFSLNKEKNLSPPQNDVKNLTKIQNQVLEKVAYYSKNTHFLSSHDLGRIMSRKKNEIDQAITFLQNSGFIKTTKANGIPYYCSIDELKQLLKQKEEIIINDKIEGKIIETVRKSVQRLYPNALIATSKELTDLDECRYFDIIFEFKSPVKNKQFIVADVYTKIPVTEYIVQSFIRKIKWTKNEVSSSNNEAEDAHYPLRGRTLGIIVCNDANQKAIDTARKCDISLLHFRDIYINYEQVRKKIELAG